MPLHSLGPKTIEPPEVGAAVGFRRLCLRSASPARTATCTARCTDVEGRTVEQGLHDRTIGRTVDLGNVKIEFLYVRFRFHPFDTLLP